MAKSGRKEERARILQETHPIMMAAKAAVMAQQSASGKMLVPCHVDQMPARSVGTRRRTDPDIVDGFGGRAVFHPVKEADHGAGTDAPSSDGGVERVGGAEFGRR